jgi:cysteine desulfurase
MKKPVFLDYQSTTPVDPAVLQRMLPYFTEEFGNPSSRQHAYGWRAEAAVKRAKRQIAKLVGADKKEAGEESLYFTSGATESNNLALQGVARTMAHQGRHLITTAIEHSSVLEPLAALQRDGFEVTTLPVSKEGLIDLENLKKSIRSDTLLISVIFGNNEIGTLQPIEEIGKICKEKNVLFHTDAVQAGAYCEIDVEAMGIDLLSLSAHKMYGPKGIGVLYVSERLMKNSGIGPLFYGGGQQAGMRPGTLNVPGIVGFGEAAHLARQERHEEVKRVMILRQRLWEGLKTKLPWARLNGPELGERRLPQNLNLHLEGVESSSLMMNLKRLALSSGSACASSDPTKTSHVLQELGLGEWEARCCVRLSLGRSTTVEDVDFAVEEIATEALRLRVE